MNAKANRPTSRKHPSPEAATPSREARATEALCGALEGVAATARAVATGHPLGGLFTREPVEWVRTALENFDSAAQAKQGRAEPSWDSKAAAGIATLTEAAEFLAGAMRDLAGGASLKHDALPNAIFAAAKMTEFLRLVPRPEYEAAIVRIWDWELPEREA